MQLRQFMAVARALSDENRVRMLLALRAGELCVCQITELFGLAPSTTSKHLSLLYDAQLVDSRKSGRWMYYRLPNSAAPAGVREAVRWAEKTLREDPRVAEDARRLKEIIALDPAELCKRQCQR